MRDLISRSKRALQLRRQSRQLLAFLHIPKTAGTSLVQALSKNFAEDRVMPGGLVYELDHHDPAYLRQQYDLLYGHVGMDALAPVATQIITLVREPTERIISLYNYWRTIPIESATVFEGGLIDPGVTLAKELSFRDFVECGHQRILNDIENGQAFQIAASNNDAGRRFLQDRSQAEIIALCQTNLSRMAAAGTTEHMGQFTHDLRRATGIKLDIPRRNVTQNRGITRAALPDDLAQRIRALNTLDYRLYEMLGGRPTPDK
ncbi:sulfotransferase family 2 domain-containing protein [Sulfitobacter sp. KE34]|uniref:sulfotransferase family 2 domain-containing protein n=1 Tax=unclassified Sulfitobacter TaxID=196795 RepID=UPI0023E15AEA|nr:MULTISPECIES: sulfotransferase family 2 domain-containing protein [unclassified Sulfitobacter]MDF3352138.1 sulfotransferase family 2 domain-containing protein [Sulfitobacter sp. KE12]MDF3355794.1 sulfotransferase family 2 domain-containing protein [Sulfitobacter sp. KE27]MDF3359242.1 sulfotransferase family 2 domain-containing protein [Sulfitobacter sp. KE33]MDF3366694.1 sulfotransferase family 2 domain-containing protein [Sulfitobacter sp. Ks34]MDF3370476.1 sulfotransferase family 2 domain